MGCLGRICGSPDDSGSVDCILSLLAFETICAEKTVAKVEESDTRDDVVLKKMKQARAGKHEWFLAYSSVV